MCILLKEMSWCKDIVGWLMRFSISSKQRGEGEVDAIICSTGGGGLLRGIMLGANRRQRAKGGPTLIAVQNFGVDSFNRSLDRSLSSHSPELPSHVVALQAIQSKCTSMGTKKCSLTTLHDAIRYNNTSGGVSTLTVTDDLSASACWQFAEMKMADGSGRMVELSCASALTSVFHPWILRELVKRSKGLREKAEKAGKLNIVIEVCGGSKVNEALLKEYKAQTGKMEARDRIRINGDDIRAPPAV